MADLEVPFVTDEELARQARERIEASIARLGGDSAAFWRAVALIYRRGLPDSGLARVGGEADESLLVPTSANSLLASVAASLGAQTLPHAAEGRRAPP
ncbi:hypothetical protein [Methylobacterium gnaphalii]|uniref:Uncharacterized protein n=1 Tax=Methylobacterium gnaphalii TaxID=1010610 RepID=A0A512JR47_9HYPH|nr:hypothetical protein [Methylobacterium gnaphalii]GEP12409.1 hypothetical protein MGN01_42540 [Methylobacterium gnaphalii]GJD71191.1 hypothetical protein MMMDOFMJ_4145 [Methylobacterium gnaphalii]